MELRNFLYLNMKLLDDYLSTIEGYLSEAEVYTDSRTNKTSGGVEAGIPVVKGSGKIESTKSEEIRREVKITKASKFEKLFNYLKKDNLEYYELINEEIFDKLSRNKFIEVLVTPRFSKLKKLIDLASKIGEIADSMNMYTNQSNLDEKNKQAITGISALKKLQNSNEISCVFSFENKEYPLVAYLVEQYFEVPQAQFIGQVNMLCKIQRKIPKGKSIKLDEIFENVKNIPLNRAQRRSMPRDLNNPDEIKDEIKGPAFIVIPIAVYQ